jgi:hypothetical protein
MCKCRKCANRKGNLYGDAVVSGLRSVVDAARAACNQHLKLSALTVVGGIAASDRKAHAAFDRIASETIFADGDHASIAFEISNRFGPAAVFAFETKDDRWLDKSVFDQLQRLCPEVTIVRVMHQGGSNERQFELPLGDSLVKYPKIVF